MLNSAICAANITEVYRKAASLDANDQPTGLPPEGDYPAAFAATYNDYAKQGLVLGAANTGGDASILENFMRGVSSHATTPANFAAALAAFWSQVAISPGIPSHGGTAVLSVTNNAADLEAAFKAAIEASTTNQSSQPYFQSLIASIEAVVKTIQWTVTELMPTVPPTPAPWPEVIA